MQLKKRGFIHLRSEEKEGIIDESAAYNFQLRIKQAVKLHCTASSDGVRPSMRQKHSYIHVLRLPLDASLHVFSSSFSLTPLCSTHQGMRLNELSTLFPTEHIFVWDARKAQIALLPRENCLSAPCWMSGFPWGTQRGFEIILCFSALTLPLQCYIVHTYVVRC